MCEGGLRSAVIGWRRVLPVAVLAVALPLGIWLPYPAAATESTSVHVHAPALQRQPLHLAGVERAATPSEFPYSIVYHPPFPNAPKLRIGGAVRGGAGGIPSLEVLAPESIGVTTSSQPTLYWFSSEPLPYPVEVVITDDHHTDPLLEIRLSEGLSAGINRLSLADHDLRLQVGIDYRWAVAAIVDPANRSRDLVASGTIRRVVASPKFVQDLKQAPVSREPVIYAENGVWYEALESLDRMIQAEPGNRVWRLLRASLLDQVDLPRVAAADREGR